MQEEQKMNYKNSVSEKNWILSQLLTSFLILLLVFLSNSGLKAQKYAYVDTDYILDNIPEYADAKAELNELSAKWQKEIEAKFAEIDKMYKNYEAESVLLPDDIKKKREDDIVNAEKEAKDLQKKRFGQDGDLFKRRQELVKPIQDKIYNAIESLATLKNYAFVFDKAGSLSLLYANPKYDLSDEILEKMGYKIGTNEEEKKE